MDSLTLHCDEGEQLLNKGSFTLARSKFEEALRIDRHCARAWQGLGRTWRYYVLAKSEHAFRMAVEEDPADCWNHIFFANALSEAGKLDEAEQHFVEAARLNHSFERWLIEFNVQKTATEEYKKKVEWLEQSITRNPNFNKLELLISTHLRNDLNVQAAKLSIKLIEIDPKNSQAFYLAGIAHEKVDKPEAEHFLLRALELDGDLQKARDALSRIQSQMNDQDNIAKKYIKNEW